MGILNCPNKNTKEWRHLVSTYGEKGAYALYIAKGDDIPGAVEAAEMITSRKLSLGDVISIANARNWVKKIFGSDESFYFVDSVMTTKGEKAYGRFINGMVELESTNDSVYSNVVRHEAFHKLFNEYLSKAEREELTDLYLSTQTDMGRIRLFDMEGNKMELEIEERLAEMYQVYRTKNEDSIFSKIFAKIKQFVGIFLSNRSRIENYFDLMNTGSLTRNSDSFSGERNMKDIREKFVTFGNYNTIKEFVLKEYNRYQKNGEESTGVPLTQDELAFETLKSLSNICKQQLQTVNTLKALREHIINTGSDYTDKNSGRVYKLDDVIKQISYMEANIIPAFEAIFKDVNFNKKDSVYNDLLNDMFPNRNSLSMKSKNADTIEDSLDEDDESDDDEATMEAKALFGVEGAFELNSSKVDRESKIFDKVKQFLYSITNRGTGALINGRYAFMNAFRMLEGIDQSNDVDKQLLYRVGEIIHNSGELGGNIVNNKAYDKRNDASILNAIYDLRRRATEISHGDIGVKALNGLPFRNDINCFYGKHDSLDYVVFDKTGERAGKFKTMNEAKAASDMHIIQRIKGERSVDFVNRALSEINNLELSAEKKVAHIQEITAIMRKVYSANLFSELMSTFNSMKESELLIANVGNKYGKRSVTYNEGAIASKDYKLIKEIEDKIVSKFKTSEEFVSFGEAFNDEYAKLKAEAKGKGGRKTMIDGAKKLVDSFIKHIGAPTRNLSPAILENGDENMAYIKALDSLSYLFKNYDMYVADEAQAKSNGFDVDEADSFDVENAKMKDLDSAFDDKLSRFLENERTTLFDLSSVHRNVGESARSGSHRDASGKKKYTLSNSSWGNDVFRKLRDVVGFLGYDSRKNDNVRPTGYMLTNFFKSGIFARGLNTIYKYKQHNGTNIENIFGDDTVVGFGGEAFETFFHRTVQAGFVSQIRGKSEYKYWQPIYIKSNRPDIESAQVKIKKYNDIIHEMIPAIFDQYMRQEINHEALYKGFKVDSCVNMKVIKAAIEEVLGKDFMRNKIVDGNFLFKNIDKESQSKIFESVDRQFSDMASELAKAVIRKGVPLDKKFLSNTKKLSLGGYLKDEYKGSSSELKQSKKDIPKNTVEMILPMLQLFVANNYVNSFALTQLAAGNSNYYGSGVKQVKRMSLVYAPGTAINVDGDIVDKKYKMLVIKDVTFGDERREERLNNVFGKEGANVADRLKSVIAKYSDGKIDYADGMGFITPERHEQLMNGLGRAYNLGNIGKPVYFGIDKNGAPISVKYSWVVLSDEMCKNSIELSNLRDHMNNHGIHEAVFESAMKTGIPIQKSTAWDDVTSSERSNDEGNVISLDNTNYRMQLNPVHNAEDEAVAYPSQLVYFLNILESNALIATNVYNHTKSLISNGLGMLRDKLSNKTTTTEALKDRLKGGTDDNIYEMINSGISINFPSIVQKSISQLASLVSKKTVGIKFDGGKLVLQASVGIRTASGRDLQFRRNIINGTPVISSDAMISKDTARRMLTKEQYAQLEDAFASGRDSDMLFTNGDALGFRIPSSEMHSALVLKIVGFHEEEGNGIIVPADVVELHGSDFDVDSLFTIFRSPIKTKNGTFVDYKVIDGVLKGVELSDDEISKLQPDDIITYHKNRIVDSFLDAFSADKNIERMMSPISMEEFDKQRNAINEIAQDNNNEDPDLSNINDYFAVHQSSFNGVSGTGIFALAMKSIAYMSRAGEDYARPKIELSSAFSPIVIDGVSYDELTGEPKKFEIMDASINAAIDNVKEQLLPYFNLNENTIPSFMAMLGMHKLSPDVAFLMMKQPIIKLLAESKGTSRNAGVKKANEVIKQLLDKAGYTDPDGNIVVDTKGGITSEQLMNGLKNLSNNRLDELRLKESFTQEDTDFVLEQYMILDMFRSFSELGNSISEFSKVLSSLRAVPSQQLRLERLLDTYDNIFVPNGEVAELFPYKIINAIKSLPHLSASLEAARFVMAKNAEIFFKHSDMVRRFAAEVVKSDFWGAKTNLEMEHSIREELVQYLMNGVDYSWDAEFKTKGGYDAVLPIQIKSKKGYTRTLTGKEAFNQHFALRLRDAIFKNRENGWNNRFLSEMQVTLNRDGTYDISMPRATEFKVEDIQELQFEFEKMCTLHADSKDKISAGDVINGYSEFQNDFVRYGVNTFGMSFGATNYSLALPSDIYKPVSDYFESLISGVNDDKLDNIRLRFMLEYATNHPESINELNRSYEPIQKNGDYFGVDGEIQYDLKFNNSLNDNEKHAPIIKRRSWMRSILYIKIADEGGISYYQKLGDSNRNKIYNFSPNMLSEKYNPYDSSFVPQYRSVVVDSMFDNRATFNSAIYKSALSKTVKQGDTIMLLDRNDITRERPVFVSVSKIGDAYVDFKKLGHAKVQDGDVKASYDNEPLNGFKYYAAFGNKSFHVNNIVMDLSRFGNTNQRALLSRLQSAGIDCNVQFVDNNRMSKISRNKSAVSGYYDMASNTIYINSDLASTFNKEQFAETMLHELVHAASSLKLESLLDKERKNELSPDESNTLSKLREAFNEARDKVGDAYAFTNEHEFMAEAISNSKFQDALKSKSVFSKILDFFKSLFGIKPNSLLSNAIESSFRVINSSEVDTKVSDRLSRRGFAKAVSTEQFSEAMKSMLMESERISVKMEDVDGESVQTEMYIDDNGKEYKRVTYGEHSMLTAANPKYRDYTKTFAETKADDRWEGIPHDVQLISDIDGKPVTRDEYAKQLDSVLELSRGKGLVIHLMDEFVLAKDDAERAEIRDKILDLERTTGVDSNNYKWFIDNIKDIYAALGINYFNDIIPEDLRDKPVAELHIKSDLLGFAGSVDLTVEHADEYRSFTDEVLGNYMSLYDFKTGNNFSTKFGTFTMKFGDQIKNITNSPVDKAKLQLALYAMIIKLENPNQRFRELRVAATSSKYEATREAPNSVVEADSFIPMIERLFKDPESLEKMGLPSDIYDKMIAQSPELFNPSHYSHSISSDAVESLQNGKTTTRTLSDINQMLNMLTQSLSLPEVMNDRVEKAKVKLKIAKLTKQKMILESDSNDINVSVATDTDTNFLTKWLGGIKDITSNAGQQLNKIFNEAKFKSQSETRSKLSNLQKLTDELKKDFKAKLDISDVLAADYGNMYKQLLKWDVINGIGKVERLILEKDGSEWNALSLAQQNYIKSYNDLMSSYFVGNGAFMNKPAVMLPNGKVLSHIQARTIIGKSEKFTYYEGFFPKSRPNDDDIARKNGGGNALLGKANPKFILRNMQESMSWYNENMYDQYDSDLIPLPVKYLGNTRMNSDQMYSYNLSNAIGDFVQWTEYKKEMDTVYSLGKSIAEDMRELDADSITGKKTNSNNADMVDFFLRRVVRKVNKGETLFGDSKVKIGTHPVTGQDMYLSAEKSMRAANKWVQSTVMWAKPLGALGNFASGLMTTALNSFSYSWARKFEGVSMVDYTAKDVAVGTARLNGLIKDSLLGNYQNSKTWKLMELLGMEDGEVRGWVERQAMSVRERTSIGEIMMGMHGLTEIGVQIVNLGAVLNNMKVDGKSMYDLYEVQDGELVYTGETRGYTIGSNGEKIPINGITAMEAARVRRILERTQGSYKEEERIGMEVNMIGSCMLSLKKYFPRVMLNLFEAKHNDINLGQYVEVGRDADGKAILQWKSRVVEGKMRTVFPFIVDFIKLGMRGFVFASSDQWKAPTARWNSLEGEQKANITNLMSTVLGFAALYAMYVFMFGSKDKDDTMKKWWFTYMIGNSTQQWNPYDQLNTLSTFTSPVAASRLFKLVGSIAKTGIAGVDLLQGDDEEAFTQEGNLKGWVELRKSIPFYASYYDIVSKMKHSDDFAAFYGAKLK